MELKLIIIVSKGGEGGKKSCKNYINLSEYNYRLQHHIERMVYL